MRMSPVLLALLFSAGCAEHRMHRWVGHPADDLVAKLGAPNEHMARRDNRETLTWSEHQFGWFWISHTCRRSVVVGWGGVIEQTAVQDCEALSTRGRFRRGSHAASCGSELHVGRIPVYFTPRCFDARTCSTS
jgi:hypothetical protein